MLTSKIERLIDREQAESRQRVLRGGGGIEIEQKGEKRERTHGRDNSVVIVRGRG